MTGHPPIKALSRFALDIVKLRGLIRVSKAPYLRSLDFVRLDTFLVRARSISNILRRRSAPHERVGVQNRAWIG
jgi:hypothetical protein